MKDNENTVEIPQEIQRELFEMHIQQQKERAIQERGKWLERLMQSEEGMRAFQRQIQWRAERAELERGEREPGTKLSDYAMGWDSSIYSSTNQEGTENEK